MKEQEIKAKKPLMCRTSLREVDEDELIFDQEWVDVLPYNAIPQSRAASFHIIVKDDSVFLQFK